MKDKPITRREYKKARESYRSIKHELHDIRHVQAMQEEMLKRTNEFLDAYMDEAELWERRAKALGYGKDSACS